MSDFAERLLEFTGDGVYRYTLDTGILLLANHGLCRIMELDTDPQDLIGRRLHDLFQYTEPPNTVRGLLRQHGEVHGLVYHFKTHKGNDRWIINDAFIVEDPDGRGPLVEAIIKDITPLKNAQTQLAQEKEFLAVTLRSIGEGLIAADGEGRITLMNKVAEELTGWKLSQALHQPLPSVLNLCDERTKESLGNISQEIMSHGSRLPLHRSAVLTTKSGQTRLVSNSGTVIRDSDSHIVGAVIVFADHTKQRLIEEEMLRVQKLQSLGVLAGGIAHDFNNILTALLGSISTVRTILPQPADAPAQKLLAQAEKATLRARDLTQQLLTFAKGGSPVRKLAALSSVIRESAEFALRGKNLKTYFDIASDLPIVEVDSGQLSQVIQNLVLNAAQVSPPGGAIEISAKPREVREEEGLPVVPGRYAQVSVKDHGPGIPAAVIAKIFDPYFTTREGGTGLGLAVCHSVIQKHNGHLWAASPEGEGATLYFLIPASSKTPHLEAAADTLPANLQAKRLLLMDDEEPILEVAKVLLESAGYAVTTAVDGDQAIRLYRDAYAAGNNYALVILDLTNSKGTGGIQTLSELRNINPEVCAIATSGYSTDQVLSDFESFGFSGALCKPFSRDDCLKAIQSALAKRRALQTDLLS